MAPAVLPNSTSVAAKRGIRIRYFRRADAPRVRELYMLGMENGSESPRVNALRATLSHPASYICYLVITTGLAISFMSPKYRILGAIMSLTIGSLFLTNRYVLSNWFTDYCINALREDLADITSYYGLEPASLSGQDFSPSGPSAFWVVECDSRNGSTEIVGCIGLDCQKKDGVVRGELRRMVVSPYHRRMGIAALLVQTLIAHAKANHVPTVWLGTTEFQRPAIDMYKKYGWVEAQNFVRVRLGLFKFRIFNFCLDLLPV